jgi:hypothetical protein
MLIFSVAVTIASFIVMLLLIGLKQNTAFIFFVLFIFGVFAISPCKNHEYLNKQEYKMSQTSKYNCMKDGYASGYYNPKIGKTVCEVYRSF